MKRTFFIGAIIILALVWFITMVVAIVLKKENKALKSKLNSSFKVKTKLLARNPHEVHHFVGADGTEGIFTLRDNGDTSIVYFSMPMVKE